MAFFESTKKTRVVCSEFDYEMAGMLAGAVTEARLCRQPPSRASWAHDFRKLRKKYDEKVIREVMEWYLPRMREAYSIKALSGNSFRLRFDELLAAKEKDDRSVKIVEEAHKVQEMLGGLSWPGKEKADELLFIQICLNNHRDFLRRIDKACELGKLPKLFGQFIHSIVGDVRAFVVSWTMDVHKMSWDWRGWNGDLLFYVVHISSFRFQIRLRELCIEYWGPGDHLNRVFNAIDEN